MLSRRNILLFAAASVVAPLAGAQTSTQQAALDWGAKLGSAWSSVLSAVVKVSINPVLQLHDFSSQADVRTQGAAMRAAFDADTAPIRDEISRFPPPPDLGDVVVQAVAAEAVADLQAEMDRLTALGELLESIVNDFAAGRTSQVAAFHMALYANFGEMSFIQAKEIKLSQLAYASGSLMGVVTQIQALDVLTQSLLYGAFLDIIRGRVAGIRAAQASLGATATAIRNLSSAFTDRAATGLPADARERVQNSLPRLRDLALDHARIVDAAAASLTSLAATTLLTDTSPISRFPEPFINQAMSILQNAGVSL